MMRNKYLFTGTVATFFAAAILAACGGGGYGGGGGGGGGGALTVSPANPSLTVGGTRTFSASGGASYGCGPYSWRSSDTAVATIDSSTGTATAKTAGSTTITASCSYNAGAYGGSGNVTLTGTTTLTVTTMATGTAARGAALVHADVSLRDANGMLAMTATDERGRFSLPLDGLTPPYRLKVQDGLGRTLYAYSLGAGAMNVDPVTDAAFHLWYGADAEAAFQGSPTRPAPDAAAAERIERSLAGFLAPALTAQGVDTTEFSVLTSPFEADSRGFDRVLDNLTESVDAEGLRLVDGSSGGEFRASFGADRSIIGSTSMSPRMGDSMSGSTH